MPSLDPTLRKLLENKVPAARQAAEEAAGAILTSLAVNRPEPFPKMTTEQRALRNALRARARQLGEGSQTEGYQPLLEELAYTQWHRMVFARFLAENNLLMHPSRVPVTLDDCAELAPEEGELDGWAVAAKYAGAMLPGIFRPEDPESGVRLAPEGQQSLEAILNALPQAVFVADDALGWMYQFWQSKKKDEINKSERKIGGKDIAPVTQLFTEDYMVRFLLENTLGAWWAARHPHSPLIKDWSYLRWKDLPLPSPAASAPWRGQGEGSGVRVESERAEPVASALCREPAAGTFPGWPERAAEVTVMDPCCGSGHFLVAAFEMLVKIRMEEEGLSEAQAAEAALRDNLFGLEIDPRCTQIAAFALALSAWKRGGWRPLPELNVACSGIPVKGYEEDWIELAGQDLRLRNAMQKLYGLFQDAPSLGSLLNPIEMIKEELYTAGFSEIEDIINSASIRNKEVDSPSTFLMYSSKSVLPAGKFLARNYSLVITNVPYLARNKQNDILQLFCANYYPSSKADLATVFLERSFKFTEEGGTVALVTPQNWLFLSSYSELRVNLLKKVKWNFVIKLGPQAFQIMNWWAANTALTIFSKHSPSPTDTVSGLDVTTNKDPFLKDSLLRISDVAIVLQKAQLNNPDSRIIFGSEFSGDLLEVFAQCLQGTSTADKPMLVRSYWEFPNLLNGWQYFQTSVTEICDYGGKTDIVNLKVLEENLIALGGAIRGRHAWGRKGVSVSIMRNLPVTLYTGEPYDANAHLILPKKDEYLGPIWMFTRSKEFLKSVRVLDQKTGVTNQTIGKVPFDYAYWKQVYEKADPIPEPHSDDPTQWLFLGHPKGSEASLQVAVARLLGYRWPQQPAGDNLDGLADGDGILCLPAVSGEAPLADRLRALLAQAYGEQWSPQRQSELLAQAGSPGKPLEEWLRDDFFPQHCRLFHNRPFLWHIWDGRKDGFSALVNYHALTKAVSNGDISTKNNGIKSPLKIA